MQSSDTAEERLTSRQRREDAVTEPCPDPVTASSRAVVVVVLASGGAHGDTEDALRAARAALDGTASPDETVVIASRSGVDAGEELLTTREAAVALGVSVSTARRWSDEGRLRTTKTSGGHRRFRLADLRDLARRSRAPARLRLAAAPEGPLPASAEILDAHRGLLAVAIPTLYENGSTGWFARDSAQAELERWFGTLAAACRSGRYAGAVTATSRLAQHAHAAGATALESALFLERLGTVTARSVSRHENAAAEVKDILRLFVVLRQAALA